jgi:integrase
MPNTEGEDRTYRKVGSPRKPNRDGTNGHSEALAKPKVKAIARRKKHYPAWYGKVLQDQKDGLRDIAIEMSPREVESAQRRFRTALERKSPETIRAYQAAARSFGKYIGLIKAKPSDIIARIIVLSRIEAETLVEEYIKWMDEDEELAPSTINTYLAALKFFVRIARKVGWCEWQLDVDGLKSSIVKDVEGVSPEELESILEFISEGNDKHILRLRMIIFMLAFMGLRISSILTLDLEHLDSEKKGAWFKMKGKGSKRVFKTIPPLTLEAIEEWLEWRGEEEGSLVQNFTNGKRITRQSVDKKLKSLGKKVGIERPLHAHSFRHFVATEGLELTDGNRHKVMQLTEHESDRMLGRYDDKRLDLGGDLSAEIEAKFLLKNLQEEDGEEDGDVEIMSAASIDDLEEEEEKIEIGYEPLDLVLDGGVIPGQVIALAGAPGLGKSTALQHGAGAMAKKSGKILYNSGEQGLRDLAGTLKRLDIRARRLLIMSEKRLEVVMSKAISLGATCLIVDSINCMSSADCRGGPGGTSQMKACSDMLIDMAKKSEIVVFLICHVTKDGDLAGPRAVEHLVDTVLHFEGEDGLPQRQIRASKNRFGSTMNKGYMKMTDKGLIPYESPRAKKKRKSFTDG